MLDVCLLKRNAHIKIPYLLKTKDPHGLMNQIKSIKTLPKLIPIMFSLISKFYRFLFAASDWLLKLKSLLN